MWWWTATLASIAFQSGGAMLSQLVDELGMAGTMRMRIGSAGRLSATGAVSLRAAAPRRALV